MQQMQRRIPVAMPFMEGREAEYVADCMRSGWISAGGEYNARFEAMFADFCGTRRAATCANGTAALHLALLAAGVGRGDEVIVPTLSYVATANAVRYCGATPVFAESEPDTMNIDPADVERCITPATRAVIPVHLYGHAASMDPLRELARTHRMVVVEDAAEAHGGEYHGRRCGSLGDVAAFSFFGNKIITTGEGGMVVSNRDDLMDQVELYRGQGGDPQRRYWFPVVGYNYRMTNLQAAVGVAQMEVADELVAGRARLAGWYDSHLGHLADRLVLPRPRPGVRHAFWMYTVVLRDARAGTRARLSTLLDDDGIETRPTFHPIHTLPPYATGEDFPVAQRLGAQGISLPSHAHLDEADVARVAERLTEHLAQI